MLPLLLLFASAAFAAPNTYSASESQYVHGNDTIILTLSYREANALHGPPGSRRNLEFIIKNMGETGHFTISQYSEDGFTGYLSTDSIYLLRDQQQTVTVTNMVVPQRRDGEKIRFTLSVEKDSGVGKRAAEEAPVKEPREQGPGWNNGNNNGPGGSGQYPGGSGQYPGGSGQYPGGSGQYPGGSGQYPGGSGQYPGGSGQYPGGSGQYPGGSGQYPGGSGQYPGGNGGYPGGSGGYFPGSHPSNRREISKTVEFTVTTEALKDDDSPDTWLRYMAESKDEACEVDSKDSNCYSYTWAVKFFVQDEESGLHLVHVSAVGGNSAINPVFYRYENFHIGTDKEQEVYAVANCCVDSMLLRVTDVAGQESELVAKSGGVGGPLDKLWIWILVGVAALIVLIVIIVVAVCCCKKRYSAVSSGD